MAFTNSLSYIINHVFLPPKLPQKDDCGAQQDTALTEVFEAALRSFKVHIPPEAHSKIVACTKMAKTMLESKDECGEVINRKVESSLGKMTGKDIYAFHICKQNAGLIIRRLPEQFSIESFELSPTSMSVMSTRGRLRRSFPGPAIGLDHSRMADLSFRKALVQLLAQLNSTTLLEACPVVSKARSQTPEVRDTAHPKFVTEMLTGILRGIGNPLDVVRIYKRTRDDVLLDNALKPWRRSPLWLLLRVALQTTLVAGDGDYHRCYKSFMIFFMARILEEAIQQSLPSDILFIMVAKISRRTLKLAVAGHASWMKYVQGVVEAAHAMLKKRWHAIEQNSDPLGAQRAWKASRLSFCEDTRLSLLTLRPYLANISNRAPIPSQLRGFMPKCPSRIRQHGSEIPQLNCFKLDDGHTARLLLMDLELWVQQCLNEWLEVNITSESACTVLATLIQDYTTAAASMYAENAENMSLMLLTTLDLWVALDKCAIHQHSLLRDYEPGFPPSLFDPLLLPYRIDMERLMHVELYIQQRTRDSRLPASLIFEDANHQDSLGVQFFERSSYHLRLRHEIEAAAALKRAQKKEELVNKRQEHRRLMQESDSKEHDEETEWNGYREVPCHPYHCGKCVLKRNANDMKISVHEWPLPYIELEAKSAVFELHVPISIAKWRDVTYRLLIDIFSPRRPSNSPATSIYTQQSFTGLHGYFRGRRGKIQLASKAKPFVVSHYGHKEIPQATDTNICVNNGLHYSLYDSVSQQWPSELLNRCDLRRKCTVQLPIGPFKMLQFALDDTTHTSNEVLARQSECSRTVNLHEFYAFGTIRAGYLLQWRNIARELTASILNFGREETYLLVAQATWQVGCSGDTRCCRESHVDLEEEEFGISLLSALEDALGAVEGSWQGAVAARSFVILAARLLSLSLHGTVHNACYAFLRRARNVALHWVRDVGLLLDDEKNTEELNALNLRALEMALTCHGTFNVDRTHLDALLSSNEDVAIIIECCIFIHDRCPAVTQQLPQSLQMLLQRYERLSHFLEPDLCRQILRDQNGIDSAIGRLWKGYRPGLPWSALSEPNSRWLTTKTSAKGDYTSMTVHYNILEGSLLVNGSLLTRLPQSYELHDTYRRLFSEKVLDVVPSTMEGMLFETRNDLCGQQIHFRMTNSELIIRSRNQQQTCEVIPLHAMHGDFTSALVQDYVHWLDVSTKTIEWRPLKNAWTYSPDNWQMRAEGHENFVLSHKEKRVIDVRSPTAKIISKLLHPLEQATHISTILNCKTGALELHLPRMKLDFLLKDSTGSLESKQFRGMVVDERQSFGAFTGLINKLVLREVKGTSQCVIVPHGTVSFKPEKDHVRVGIDTTSAILVKYHLYQVDRQLGRLVDNGSLQSRLLRLYLHATTSHCLVDELTGRTGTEEALSGLRGAATRSFIELEPADIELLEKLAQLTPRRKFYPDHLQVMQRVEWAPLSPLAQHCAFSKEVASVFNLAQSFQCFQEQPRELPKLDMRGKPLLLDRAAIRDSSFQIHDFGASAFTIDYDAVYKARDHVSSTRELQSCSTARLVDSWSTNLKVSSSLLSEISSWAKLVLGAGPGSDLTLGFDVRLLDALDSFLPDHWCSLQDTLSRSMAEGDKYNIMILLSTLSYSTHAKQDLVQTLLAFATVRELRVLQLPQYSAFQLADGYEPKKDKLISLTTRRVRDFHQCPEYNLPNLYGEKKKAADSRRLQLYQLTKNEHIQAFVRELIAQWPTVDIYSPTSLNYDTYIEVEATMTPARRCFQSWYQNVAFKKHIQQTQIVLDTLSPEQCNLKKYSFSPPADAYKYRRAHVIFLDLTSNPAPCLLALDRRDYNEWITRANGQSTDHSKLKQLLEEVSSQCANVHERKYAADLLKSFAALCENTSSELRPPLELATLLDAHLTQARDRVTTMYQTICDKLQSGSSDLVRRAGMLPRLSPISLLSHLANDKVFNLPKDWKVSLIQYGVSITMLQRAQRLVTAAGNMPDLLSELENPGHQDWDPMCHPEWLLLELEDNALIRQEQAQISREMMYPSSESNSVMQFNMGKGKSSYIIPISAAHLADRTKLVRVIVLKALAKQMFQLLVKKLGGMLNRRIFYMPISRSLKLNAEQATQIYNLYQECRLTGGILLTQPEHILSFELMGLDRLLSGDLEIGHSLVKSQDWLFLNSRDILDESDEILSVRFELIYTNGMQRAIEFSPERWTITEIVLGYVARAAYQVLERFPHGLEVIPSQPGGFPRIRILQILAGDELLGNVAQQLCEDGLPGIPVWNLSNGVRAVLFRFITDPNPTMSVTQSLENSVFASESMRSGLLLLRGLFACGILRFAFGQKRWRVNYGLDPSRSLLAVPYHAKDSPAARAEFSHPDSTIVLTCLSYYYGGLTDQQIITSIEALQLSDHAQEEYESWVKDAPEMPAAFKHLTGINLSNKGQCSREVFPPLRFAKAAIDFYLSAIVFPAEMKEFPYKLSSSGWDIAREKGYPTTGFSGTNDSRYVLPLSIKQCDLPAQLSTNATVLDCLLRPENSFMDMGQHSTTEIFDAEALLNMVLTSNPPVRVILDVGAQVLELQNEEVAHAWLSRVPESEAQAVIFFDNRNEICVLSRDGIKEALLISPFAKQMDQCLVYLDESHTRGTDLKLPAYYRAMVTLGPGLTKDRLAQACMRMRKLGKGQSVVFCSSMEVQRDILEYNNKVGGPIEVADVLKWCISGTYAHMRKSIPLWATQGVRHQRRRVARTESPTDAEYANKLLEPEAQSLQQRYGHGNAGLEEQIFGNITDQSLMGREEQLNAIQDKCRMFEIVSFDTATLQEEQERELSPENEREQQVELPPAATPCRHSIHQDVRSFITHGTLHDFSKAFRPAFETLRSTTALQYYEPAAWPQDLLVTTDFAKTVKVRAGQSLDSFLRPVHWIVTCKTESPVKCVIISPFEAQELLPTIRLHKRVTLHVFSPRLRQSARTLEDLSFCSIPAVPKSWSTPPTGMLLNLFAGQLYVRSYEDYELLCGFLGLCSHRPDENIEVACDGFIIPTSRINSSSAVTRACSFKTSPVAFVRMMMALRRKGQSLAASHVGRILNGELVLRDQF